MKSAVKDRVIICLKNNSSVCCKQAALHCSRWWSSSGGIYEWWKAEQGDWCTDWWSKCSSALASSLCVDTPAAFKHGKAILNRSLFRWSHGHEFWFMTEGILSRDQAAEMGFLRRVRGVIPRDNVRNCEIRKALNVETLIDQIKRSQLRSFGNMSRMSHKNWRGKSWWL